MSLVPEGTLGDVVLLGAIIALLAIGLIAFEYARREGDD